MSDAIRVVTMTEADLAALVERADNTARSSRKEVLGWSVFWRRQKQRWILSRLIGRKWVQKLIPLPPTSTKEEAVDWSSHWMRENPLMDWETRSPVVASSIGLGDVEPIPAPSRQGVYFLHMLRFVKIGWSDNVRARLRRLGPQCPVRPRLLLVESGGADEERVLHSRFAHLRARQDVRRHEWFHARAELAEYILAQRGVVARTGVVGQ